jgi:hypothetical protein
VNAPSATESHYHNDKFDEVLESLHSEIHDFVLERELLENALE